MSNFVYIDNLSKRGKTAISYHIFDQLVTKALESLPNVSVSKKMNKAQKILLQRPVKTTIRQGIAHVWVSVDVKEGTDVLEASTMIQQEVVNTFLTIAEHVPFDVQVKVESII